MLNESVLKSPWIAWRLIKNPYVQAWALAVLTSFSSAMANDKCQSKTHVNAQSWKIEGASANCKIAPKIKAVVNTWAGWNAEDTKATIAARVAYENSVWKTSDNWNKYDQTVTGASVWTHWLGASLTKRKVVKGEQWARTDRSHSINVSGSWNSGRIQYQHNAKDVPAYKQFSYETDISKAMRAKKAAAAKK